MLSSLLFCCGWLGHLTCEWSLFIFLPSSFAPITFLSFVALVGIVCQPKHFNSGEIVKSSLCARPTPNRTRMSAEKLPSSCELLTCPGSLLAGWAYKKHIVLVRTGCCHSGSLWISHPLTYAWMPWCASLGRKSFCEIFVLERDGMICYI